ncbi:MAG: hypothetical protein JSC161_000795 [Candidatus Tokpelaia sp. JSC161]|jgi:Fe-S cluster biogenesis protein NfuA|nr:MAG: hypothetical protein JSC161_000795 [Candidatus Tokpelaia sp. JSC161]
MFIQTEETPNPATLKFFPGCVISDVSEEFRDVESAAGRSPLAVKLFALPGIQSIFFSYNYIAVSKSAGDWVSLRPLVLDVILEHLMSGTPILLKGFQSDEQEFFSPEDTELVELIKSLIETRVRPAVAHDGGDITFQGFEGGIVYLKMRGACASCPSSTATLKNGIENFLRNFVPEVRGVEALPR